MTQMSNVILKISPFNVKLPAKDIWSHDQFKVMQPVVTDPNKSHHQSWNCSTNGTTNRMVAQLVARPVMRVVSPWLRAIDGTTLDDSSHDHVRPICDLLRFVLVGPEF